MARKQRGGRKETGRPKSGPRKIQHQGGLREDREANPQSVPPRLSLIDVARNTERQRSQKHGSSKEFQLQFVPGGLLESNTEQRGKLTPGQGNKRAGPPRNGAEAVCTPRTSARQSSSDDTPAKGRREQTSDSEDDVVIFQGRIATNGRQRNYESSRSIQNPMAGNLSRSESHATASDWSKQQSRHEKASWPTHTDFRTGHSEDIRNDRTQHGLDFSYGHGYESDDRGPDMSDDEAAIEDYIANIIAHDSDRESDTEQVRKSWEANDGHSTLDYELSNDPLLPSSPLQALSPPASVKQDSEIEPGSMSSDEAASITSSVNTIEQASHDLQVAFDHLDRPMFNSARRTIKSTTLWRKERFIDQNESLEDGLATSAGLKSDTSDLAVSGELTQPADQRVSPTASTGRRPKEDWPEKATTSAISSVSPGWEQSNDFDIADRSRKSIADGLYLGMELTDSELERTLLESWKKDKAKKRDRKREREEARAKGLLGSRRNATFAATNQLQESDWVALAAHIRAFLDSSDEFLTLPPMDKRNRRAVHEFANAFNLKSKSVGSGEKRFPTLSRTSRTIRATDVLFEEIESRLARRLTKGAEKQYRDTPPRKGPRTGKSSFAAASYRDGEVVGAAAPEIGLDNRGRAMLEKMGWSSGTALGAANNKGILLPVSHTVKNSRLGLG